MLGGPCDDVHACLQIEDFASHAEMELIFGDLGRESRDSRLFGRSFD